eukprot:775769_1
MSDGVSDELLLNVSIKELNSPYKLSQFISQLPYYKSLFCNGNKPKHTDIHPDDLEDVVMCDQLSKFILEQQLTGRFFRDDFVKIEFDDMIRHLSIPESYDYDWVWNALTHAIRDDHEHKTEHLQWINSNWDKLQIHLNRTQGSKCEKVHNCQAVHRIILILHLYHSSMNKIRNNHRFRGNSNGLKLQRVAGPIQET